MCRLIKGMNLPWKVVFFHFWFKCYKLSLSSMFVLREAAWTEWSHGDWCPPTLTAANFRGNVTIPESLCNVTTYEMDSILCRPDGHRPGNVRLQLRWPGAGERIVCRDMWALDDWPMFCLIVCRSQTWDTGSQLSVLNMESDQARAGHTHLSARSCPALYNSGNVLRVLCRVWF